MLSCSGVQVAAVILFETKSIFMGWRGKDLRKAKLAEKDNL